METAPGFGRVARNVTALALSAGAIFAGWAFASQFTALWRDNLSDIHVAPSMEDGLRKREQWVHTVRAAAAMRNHCEAILLKARARIPEIMALEPQLSGAKRWSPGVRKAMQEKVARQREAVRPCESAELFLSLQGEQPGFFPHLLGLSKFFSAAADALAEKRIAPAAELVSRLKAELRQWDALLACANEAKPRSVLGVVVRPRTWYVAVEEAPAFRGTPAEAWVWLAGRPAQKHRRSPLSAAAI